MGEKVKKKTEKWEGTVLPALELIVFFGILLLLVLLFPAKEEEPLSKERTPIQLKYGYGIEGVAFGFPEKMDLYPIAIVDNDPLPVKSELYLHADPDGFILFMYEKSTGVELNPQDAVERAIAHALQRITWNHDVKLSMTRSKSLSLNGAGILVRSTYFSPPRFVLKKCLGDPASLKSKDAISNHLPLSKVQGFG